MVKQTEETDELRRAYTTLLKRTRSMFAANEGTKMADHEPSKALKLEVKRISDYGPVIHAASSLEGPSNTSAAEPTMMLEGGAPLLALGGPGVDSAVVANAVSEAKEGARARVSKAMADPESEEANARPQEKMSIVPVGRSGVNALALKESRKLEPEWHAPWKLMRVISGHQGWVRAIAIDPSNEWFVTGASDCTIKCFDLASGTLKLTLTGHISCVRGLAVSSTRPYMFSVSEDKSVKCWDLEYNKVIRHYHGHLSGVYSCSLHPSLDVLCTGGRDCAVRMWDVRTEREIHCLTGHDNTVVDIKTQSNDPQIISGSMDSTIRLWDIVGGKVRTVLTNHKKSVRALALHPRDFSFASGSAENIKKWSFPDGKFLTNMMINQHSIINTMSINEDGVLFAGGDNGTMAMCDYRTGYCFQEMTTQVQSGSLDSEAGIFASEFDLTGSRLITGEADKTIKIWREDDTASPETHPIQFKQNMNPSKY